MFQFFLIAFAVMLLDLCYAEVRGSCVNYLQVLFAARYGRLVESLIAAAEHARSDELPHKILLVQVALHIRPETHGEKRVN